jgi:hypothetical protein
MKNAIAITTKPQAKTIVSALRRELKALDKGTTALTHNECLAALDEDTNPKSAAAVPATDRPKYPLVNDGQFDFVEAGEYGEIFSGDFTALVGTLDELQARGEINGATRATDGSGVDLEEAGESEVFWDDQSTVERDGFKVMLDDDGGEHSEAQMVIAPEGTSDPYDDEDLVIRRKLIDAFVEYFAENEIDKKAREGDFSKAEEVIGFCLTEKEEEALSVRLFDTKPLF